MAVGHRSARGWPAVSSSTMVGRTISHYRIVGQVGAGGMGVVYGAEDIRLGRPVALKFVPEELARSSRAVDRFRVEARAASGLNHPHICTIYDIGDDDGRPFIVMELLKGQTLRERLAAGPMKALQVVDVGVQVADALDAAHAQGIVHRDIKPANLFLTDRGQVKVMDFGLAKLLSLKSGAEGSTTTVEAAPLDQLTAPGITVGTVAYMSPEQIANDQVDGRTDLFSLGVVLYECATGHRPFDGNNSAVILAAILNQAPVAPAILNPHLPLRLQEVINNCLEKDRDLRYQTATDLRADLKRVRRDLESGRSAAVGAGHEVRANRSGSGAVPAEGAPPVTDATPPLGRSEEPTLSPDTVNPASGLTAAGAASRRLATVSVGAALVLAAVTAYVVWPRDQTRDETSGAETRNAEIRLARPESPPADATSKNSRGPELPLRRVVELAQRSLTARDYRAALAYADEVLTVQPDNAEATAVRDQARVQLGRFDSAMSTARRLLGAGDARGAARAVAAARTIDPLGPGVAELSALVSDLLSAQAASARQEARPTQPVPAPPIASVATAPGAGTRDPGVAPSSVPAPSPVAPAASSAAQPPGATPGSQPQPAAPPSVPVPPPDTPPDPAPPSRPAVAAGAAPGGAARRKPAPSEAGAPAAEDDEAAIRRVVATYARAIETKSLSLFRSVKPNLSRAEEQRIASGFRAVASQQVAISILSIEQRGDTAVVRLRRHDTIDAGGRRQETETEQRLTLARAEGGWTIVEIGR